jgi:uncharacterized membrane protein/thiol-disulfide isomerase/thioredoxin
MMRKNQMPVVVLIICLALPAVAWGAGPEVRAVLFYSPSCPHCHKVITEDLPPLMKTYGNRLQIAGVDVSTPEGHALFGAAIDHFNIPAPQGVPTLIIGDNVLVGSIEIPERLPGLIEHYLAQGGVDWPAIPGLAITLTPTVTSGGVPTSSAGVLPTPGHTPMATPATTPASQPVPTYDLALAANNPAAITGRSSASIRSKLERDPFGNGLAVVVLCGMVISVGRVTVGSVRARREPANSQRESDPPDWRGYAVALLSIVGLGVAGYLTYVETARVTAVCGPIGDCNTVQQSEYARLFGVIPIGLLGVAGYVAILVVWVWAQLGRGRFRQLAWLALFGMALFGTLFSIYLTFLEPFVIGATCAWCLTSAVTMTLVLSLSAKPGIAQVRRFADTG